MTERETRVSNAPVEVREFEGKPAIEGYASVFNQLSEDLGGWREIIKPGAFRDVLMNDVRALWQHDPRYVLGRRKNGTLSLWEDDYGLRYRAIPPNAQWARDVLETIQRGDVDQSSFAFLVTTGAQWMIEKDGTVIRQISLFADFWDVGPVTFPAYPATTADVRSKIDELRAQLDKTAEQAAELTVRARQNAERQRVLHLYGG